MINGADGTAKVTSRWIALGIEIHSRATATSWQPFARAGMGLLSLSSKGDARTPFVGYQREDAGLAALAGVGMRFRLTRNIAVCGAFQGLRALQPVAMQFNDTTVAQYGTFVAIGTLGVALSVP